MLLSLLDKLCVCEGQYMSDHWFPQLHFQLMSTSALLFQGLTTFSLFFHWHSYSRTRGKVWVLSRPSSRGICTGVWCFSLSSKVMIGLKYSFHLDWYIQSSLQGLAVWKTFSLVYSPCSDRIHCWILYQQWKQHFFWEHSGGLDIGKPLAFLLF